MDILARGMPNERQTILLRMNNVDNQLLIFYREKGKFGCLWCGDVEKIHSRYSTISLSFLEVLLSTLLVALFIGGMLYHCNKSGTVAVVAFSFQGGSVFDLYPGRITRTKELSACGL